MVDRKRVGRRMSVLPASCAIGACALAMSAWAGAQEGPAIAYSTNDLGMEFVSVAAGQFPMGCSEGVKPMECSADGLGSQPL